MQDAKAIFELHPNAMELLGFMFNEDGDIWADLDEPIGIIRAVVPQFSRERLAKALAQLDSLLSGRFTEEELKASYRYAGASLDFGCSTSELLTMVRDYVRKYCAQE